jgi:signal transduction histidine kinase
MSSTSNSDQFIVTNPGLDREPVAAPAGAWLVLMDTSFAPSAGRVFLLEKDVVLGRDQAADIPVLDGDISRKHAEVRRRKSVDVLIDLSSKNGTFVNRHRVESAELKNGDLIELGRSALLKYVRHDPLEIRCAHLFEQAQHAIRARDEFLSVASHELKTPLTSLQLQLEVMSRELERSDGAKKLRDRMGVMERQTKRLSMLVGRLLDVSNVKPGHLELQFEEVELTQLVTDLCHRMRDDFERAGCRVLLTLPTKVTGRWDQSRIEQVVTNLLTNAIKYGRGTPIRVAVQAFPSHAQLIVQDEGPGVAPEHHQRVFERFERLASRNVSGLGLGLYIARQVVEAHGGFIRLESVPGCGARFVVTLPR